MAIADTAQLVASLELQDKFSGPAKNAVGSVDKLQSGIGRLQAGFGQMARGTGQVASGLGRIGLAASAAAAGGLLAVVKTSADFEAAFTNVRKTVDGTKADLDGLEQAFRQMARTGPSSFEELSGIGAEAGALGIARKDIVGFTDVVRRLAVSTNLSSDQASTALGQLGNVLHLTGDDFRDFADSLVALGNKGASTEDQIVAIAARFGAAGNAAGLTKEEILALSSATASMGIQVESAGSSLSRIFSSVATNIGTSSDKAVAFAKVLGLSAKEFRDAWQRDAVGTFEDFLTQLGKLNQFAQAKVLKDIGITNVRDVAAVRLMSQNVGFVADQLKVATSAQGALNKESQQFFDTTSGQWKTLVNNLRDAAATIGNELLPVTKDLIQRFTAFLNKPETRQQLRDFGRGLADTIKGIDFGKLVDAGKQAVQIAKAAFDIFNALPGPIKAGLIGGVALNRATFGGASLLLRGLGNIGGGLLTTALGGRGGILGLFGSRGATPATPVFTKEVGLGGAPGTPAVPGGGGFLSSFAKGAGVVFGLAAAEQIGEFFGHTFFFDPTVKPAVKFEQTQFDKLVQSNDPTAIQHGLDAVDRGLADLHSTLGQPGSILGFAGDFLLRDQISELERQRTTLEESKKAALATAEAAQSSNKTEQQILAEAKGQHLAAATTAANIKILEQRLIRDPNFKPQVTSVAEFLRLLRRTSEFGAKGVGTDIELGRKTGRDPVGDAFVALARRLTPPALKSVEVQGEISRHIKALEQVQGRLLKQGNIDAARHAQRNIDALGRLIGEVDKTIPHFRQLEAKQDRQRDAIRDSAAQTANHLRIMQSLERRTGDAAVVTSRKNFSPKVNVNVNATTTVSINDVVRAITHSNTAVGSGPGGPAPVGILG